jgi:hypothetical protein
LEKYLKKMGLPTSRKIGFPCPYGKGKVKEASAECKGRIEKAHPIVPKNEEKKKARQAPAMLEAMARQPKAANVAKAAPGPKAPAARKLAPPKLHNLATVTRTYISPAATPPSVWGQKGAAPVLANAHLPAADPAADPLALTPDPAAAAQGPRAAQVTVGLVLEEALTKGLTKAQKKNLARKKKREAAGGLDTLSEASSDHQDAAAAAGVLADGAGPSAGAAAAGNHALVGFDGAAMGNCQNDLLAQQGHKFITDYAKYAALLGLMDADSSEEEDSEGEEEEHGEGVDGAGAEAYMHGGDVSPAFGDGFNAPAYPAPVAVPVVAPVPQAAPVVAPVAVPIAAPVAVPIAAPVAVPIAAPVAAVPEPQAAAAAGKVAMTEEEYNEAYNKAMAASIMSAQVEDEMRRQRQVLASGGFTAAFSKPAPAGYTYPGALDLPVAAPVVAPVAAPTQFYGQTKAQPEAPAAGRGGGWVFGGGDQGAALPPHIPAGYAQYGAYGEGGVVAPMAAGHSAPEVASEDEDDDGLSTLLALCGVAG